jgi:putative FmdB family regulatory protein
VTRYQYRCPPHGAFDVSRPMGMALDRWPCPVCSSDAMRVFSAPMVSSVPRALISLVDRTEKTRDQPDIVTSLPRREPHRRTPMAPASPALQRLPRP